MSVQTTRQGTPQLRAASPPRRAAETPTERKAQDRQIRLRFPRPVALAWARAVTVEDPSERMIRLAAVTTTVSRFLAAVSLADLLGRGPLPPALRAFEKRLQRPPDGVWLEFACKLANAASEAADLAAPTSESFVPELATWWRTTIDGETQEQRLNQAIRMRNAFAHGTAPDRGVRQQQCDELESLLRESMTNLAWLEGYRVARVETARPDTSGMFSGSVSLYVGSDDVPWSCSATWRGWLSEGAMYLLSPDGSRALPLAPWFAIAPVTDGSPERLLMWARLGKTGGVALGDGRSDDERWHNDLPTLDGAAVPTWKQLFHNDDSQTRRRFARIDVCPEGHCLAVDGEPDEHIAALRARYEIGAPIGYGGMAVVYGARDTQLEEGVAIKVLRESLAGDSTTLERFGRECRVLHKLRHPNVVPLLNVGYLDDGRPFLVTRLAARGSLHERVADVAPPEQVIDWMNQALAGLQAIHEEGVVHRDIKPSNLLVDESGRVMIADFGIAVAGDGLELTKTLERIGSQAYMAPQLLQGQNATPETDMYALAVTAHELATGQRPGPHGPGAGAPDAVAQWIHGLLGGEGTHFAAPTPRTPAARPGDAQRVRASTARHWKPWLLAASLALVAGAIAATLFDRSNGDRATQGTPDDSTTSATETPPSFQAPAQPVEAAMHAYRDFRAAQQALQRRLLDQEESEGDLDELARFWGDGCYPCWWRSGDKPVSWVMEHIYNRNRHHRTDFAIDHLAHLVTNEHGVWLMSDDRILDARADDLAWRSHQRVVRMVRDGDRWVVRGEVLAQHIDRWRERFGLSTDVLPSVYASRGPCPSLVDTVAQQEWLIPEQPYWTADEVNALLTALGAPQTGVEPTGDFRHDCAANGLFAWRVPSSDEIRAFVAQRQRAEPTFSAQGHAWVYGAPELGSVNLERPTLAGLAPEARNRLWLVRFCPLGTAWNADVGACVEGG